MGLGYVGLPLAIEFAKTRKIVGFDIDQQRVSQLNDDHDATGEISSDELKSTDLFITDDLDQLAGCNCYIIAVPTPTDAWNRPDLGALINASRSVARVLSPGDLVVFESTVFPGATEEICGAAISEVAGLTVAGDNDDDWRTSFYLGYSPERANPGDRERTIRDIVKVTSGSTRDASDIVDALYKTVVTAGTYKAPSIRVAEAAKVIENVQRDVNIALVNELAILFHKLGLETNEVLKAASTKWNFLPFQPGLVGGHCIGVDPYYLTHKAAEVGHHPEIILAGRRINDSMSAHIAHRVVALMVGKGIGIAQSRVLILGLTFKEDCPDTRNSKVFDLAKALGNYNAIVEVYDPNVPIDGPSAEHVDLLEAPRPAAYDAVIVAVAHKEFIDMGVDQIRTFGKDCHVIFDVKNVFDRKQVDGSL